MVKCGELPCTISNVAHNLGKEVYSISTTRAQLISKGIIYPVRYKELDFTVPGTFKDLMNIKNGIINNSKHSFKECLDMLADGSCLL